MTQAIGRLAPSPTGSQHLGNARTYLVAWLSIRQQAGKIKLRVEDIDSPRVKPEATVQILEELIWLGLIWDDEPVIQSVWQGRYQRALELLKQAELVYPCTCTRKDIEQAASAPHLEHELPPYPGLCAHRCVADARSITGRPYAWRFRTVQPPSYDDLFVGTVHPRPEYAGDFVVWKNNDTPAYQLAVVVDDHEAGITEVIRGDDLIPSTPRQLQLYAALGYTPPRFGHVPLVVGTDGRRLAKRHGDARLSSFRQAGMTAERLLGFLAYTCGWQTTNAPTTATELISRFNWSSIPKTPLVLTETMLSDLMK